MKTLKIIPFLLAACLKLSGQNAVLVIDETRNGNEGKSYYIVKSLTLGNGFTWTASTHGAFFATMANPTTENFPPSGDQNYVRTETTLIPGVTTEVALTPLPITQKNMAYEYIDGLGRKSQSVAVKASPSQTDLTIPMEYDAYGRMIKEYLPFAPSQSNGAFRANEAVSFYSSPPTGVSQDTRPFKENIFEASPLNRVTDIYGPGLEWKNGTVSKAMKSLTKVNLATENITRWKYFLTGTPEKDATYPDNQLLVQETTDEDGQITKVYKNLRDQVVLNRVGDGTSWFDTHYIYSPAGLLMIVIQPEGVARLAAEFDAATATGKTAFLNRWCFQYQYDDEQRMIAKRIPGWEPGYWATTVYDQWNRVVFTQTPAQKGRNEYFFNKYDRFNRVIMTGLYTSASDRATLQASVNSHYATYPANRFETELNNATGYTQDKCFPLSPAETTLLSVSYYDNYDFVPYTGWDAEGVAANYDFVAIAGFPQSADLLTSVKGYMTGAKVRVIGQGQSRWLNSVTRYDKKYRAVQIIAENFVGGRDRVTTQFDFVGKPLKTQSYHTGTSTALTTLRELEYDHAGRLLNLYQTTDTGPRTLLASNKYNALGQLIEKNIHSTDNGASFLQSMDMRYNIRGWLTNINKSDLSNDGVVNNDANDLFGMEILYNPATQPAITGYTPTADNKVPKLYNGNITAIKWKADTKQVSMTPVERIYGFDYDVLNRLKKAYYAANNAGAWSADAGLFNEGIKSYDKNGNIQGIDRQGKINGASSVIDNTTYAYNYSGTIPNFAGISNRLISVTDLGSSYGFKDAAAAVTEEYKYDASGNLTFDNNKGISSITYNHLNLPSTIEFSPPSGVKDRIIYTYDANGVKLKMEVYKNGTAGANGTLVWSTDYVGDVQYDNAQLTFASTPEGRVVKNSTGYDYEYFYKDHQGNVRLAYGSLKETVSHRATMENPPPPSTLGSDENGIFKNINSSRYTQVSPQNFNITKPSDLALVPANSSKTHGTSQPIGPAKMLTLAAGDKVKMEVFATYNQTTGSTSTMLASSLITAVATGTFGYVSGETAFSSFNTNIPLIPGTGSASATLPKAYLAFLFFNTSYQFVTSGAISISTSAFNAFEKLERTFTAAQAGYLYVYVANESNTASSYVYFDEMLLVHQKANSTLQVTQASDYYPFGLAFNAYQADRISEAFAPIQKNRYGFQGQELQSDLDLGWSQFKWRMHDPALGRFVGVDPMSDQYLYNSTYSFSENKLVSHVELEGLEAFETKFADNGQPKLYSTQDATRGPTMVRLEFEKKEPTAPQYFISIGPTDIHHPNAFPRHEVAMRNGVEIAGAIEGVYALRNLPNVLNYFKSLDDVGKGISDFKSLDDGMNIKFPTGNLGLGDVMKADAIVDVAKGSAKQFNGITGVYVHEFTSGTVYVGKAKNLAQRPVTSLKELMTYPKYKGTAAKAGDQYSGTSYFYKLENSGYDNVYELENEILKRYGGTMTKGGQTYNIRGIPGFD